MALGMQLFGVASFATPLRYARSFSLDSAEGFVRLRIFVNKDTTTYALCPAGRCPSKIDRRVKVLSIPLHRVICMTSVHEGYLEVLNLRDHIVGVDQASFICDSALRAMGKRHAWAEVGSDAQTDWERVVALHPDVILYSYPPGGVSSLNPKANALHIPALATPEWLENNPLGRAEWVRLYGILFGRERMADSLFEVVRHGYDSLKAGMKMRKRRPTAIVGLGWRGQWFVSGGGSYVAQLLRDAGIHYLWEDDRHTGALTLGLEGVLDKGREADLWLNAGEARSLAGLESMESRSVKFRAFREEHVYQNDAHHCAEGGNAYWETGAIRPDLLLSDLTHIADGTLDSRSGNYYRRLPKNNSK